MKNLKNYGQFVNESKKTNINESFTITMSQLPQVGDIVDKIDWKEGEKIAFIDFKGIKNIPVQILDNEEVAEEVE